MHALEGNDVAEHFYVLYLSRSNKVIGYSLISLGGITGTVADVRLILQSALGCGAVYIMLCHNHPSGSLKPSSADETLTKKIKEACRYHDITLVDHMIISDEGYYSFAEEGIL